MSIIWTPSLHSIFSIPPNHSFGHSDPGDMIGKSCLTRSLRFCSFFVWIPSRTSNFFSVAVLVEGDSIGWVPRVGLVPKVTPDE
jgi:hypothetical protein